MSEHFKVHPDSPAYPEIHISHWRGQDKEVGETDNVLPRFSGGLTKREYFAGLAILSVHTQGNFSHDLAPRIAAHCVKMADALIAELNQPESGHG
jgi:hypothetical protein